MRRRNLIAGAMAVSTVLSCPSILRARTLFRLALTPVFLDNDALVIEQLRLALSEGMGRDIELVQRRTYQEITGAILDGSVDAAWVCGYPYVQYREQLELLGVPIWRGRPLYQSYLIVGPDDPATSLADLRGGVHAFSDPNSNSGYLVTASDLARMGESPDAFFQRSIFTYGHRNVVRAVSAGLTRSGSVDGYVWEVLAQVEPELTAGTRVIVKSEWLGFPPFAARRDRAGQEDVRKFTSALLSLEDRASGRAVLRLLFLDRIAHEEDAVFDGIARRMELLRKTQ